MSSTASLRPLVFSSRLSKSTTPRNVPVPLPSLPLRVASISPSLTTTLAARIATTSTTTSPFTTSSRPPAASMPKSALVQASSLPLRTQQTQTQTQTLTKRAKSTASSSPSPSSPASSSSSPSASASTSTSTPSSTAADALDWTAFFKLRASRRRFSLISSILGALACTTAGPQIIISLQEDIETLAASWGMDPIFILGLGVVACASAGWLLGPFVGNACWKLVHRRNRAAFAAKDKDLYSRIKRFRVDPSANSFSNPVPDYYGEKINSVAGYRQWLKDQRVYNRKKINFV